jgi:hypothetical protein
MGAVEFRSSARSCVSQHVGNLPLVSRSAGGRDHAPKGPAQVPGACTPIALHITAPACVATRRSPSTVKMPVYHHSTIVRSSSTADGGSPDAGAVLRTSCVSSRIFAGTASSASRYVEATRESSVVRPTRRCERRRNSSPRWPFVLAVGALWPRPRRARRWRTGQAWPVSAAADGHRTDASYPESESRHRQKPVYDMNPQPSADFSCFSEVHNMFPPPSRHVTRSANGALAEAQSCWHA